MNQNDDGRVPLGERVAQYAIVGPAIFVMETMPELALPVHNHPSGEPVSPGEVWIELHRTWVRLDGQWVSGWRGGEHFAFRPNWLNRWKIRRAARAWERSRP